MRIKQHSLLRLEVGTTPRMLAAPRAVLINALILIIISQSQGETVNYHTLLLSLWKTNGPRVGLRFGDDVIRNISTPEYLCGGLENDNLKFKASFRDELFLTGTCSVFAGTFFILCACPPLRFAHLGENQHKVERTEHIKLANIICLWVKHVTLTQTQSQDKKKPAARLNNSHSHKVKIHIILVGCYNPILLNTTQHFPQPWDKWPLLLILSGL